MNSSFKNHSTPVGITQIEFGTPSLSQATVKMEEYHDLLKSTEAWIENTRRLLANPADYDSSKSLSHCASTLQVSVLSEFPGSHRVCISVAYYQHGASLPPLFPWKTTLSSAMLHGRRKLGRVAGSAWVFWRPGSYSVCPSNYLRTFGVSSMSLGFPHLWNQNVALNVIDSFRGRILRRLPTFLSPDVRDLRNLFPFNVSRNMSIVTPLIRVYYYMAKVME